MSKLLRTNPDRIREQRNFAFATLLKWQFCLCMWPYVVVQVCTNGDHFQFYIATLYRQILAHNRPARRISLPASLPHCSQTLTLAKNSSKSPLPHTGNVVLVSPGMAVQWLGVLICATRIVFLCSGRLPSLLPRPRYQKFIAYVGSIQ
jgi:hypothetical protein